MAIAAVDGRGWNAVGVGSRLEGKSFDLIPALGAGPDHAVFGREFLTRPHASAETGILSLKHETLRIPTIFYEIRYSAFTALPAS